MLRTFEPARRNIPRAEASWSNERVDRGEAAFTGLVREHADAVFGFVLRRVRDAGLAEDLAQETFLRAWRARGGRRPDASVRGWLLAIAMNVVRDDARRRRRRPIEAADEIPDAPGGSDPAERAEASEALDRFRAALDALPDNHREMFLLRERDGLPYREIAEVLRCPVGTVMSGLARAREKLLEALQS